MSLAGRTSQVTAEKHSRARSRFRLRESRGLHIATSTSRADHLRAQVVITARARDGLNVTIPNQSIRGLWQAITRRSRNTLPTSSGARAARALGLETRTALTALA